LYFGIVVFEELLSLKVIVSFLLFISLSLTAQKKLYYFSGSDWCIPCMKFQKEFIESEDFIQFRKEYKVDFEILDFPQGRKSILKQELQRRDSLAGLYNKTGSFPYLTIVDNTNSISIDHKRSSDVIIDELEERFESMLSQTRIKMGSLLTIQFSSHDTSLFEICWNEVDRINKIISSWNASSEVSRINKGSGEKPVKISRELFSLLSYCKELSETTQGAFDITIKPALNIWYWKTGIVPSDSLINSVIGLVNFKNLELNKITLTAYLTKKGMSIDFGAIGKGYMADKITSLLKLKGVTEGYINCGGDIFSFSSKISTSIIGIVNPINTNDILFSLEVSNASVVTSGNYYRFFKSEGKKYSHIVNPKNCKPVENDIVSVTVVAPNATLADALSTAVTVLGVKVGIDLINQLPLTEVVIVTKSGETFFSNDIKILEKK
jgi:thiamine biosynthesis lipoprotein|tara:strand:- start:31218 stop:32528 length:1311 start_codon:yes stop_codon:yes gene_type:complete